MSQYYSPPPVPPRYGNNGSVHPPPQPGPSASILLWIFCAPIRGSISNDDGSDCDASSVLPPPPPGPPPPVAAGYPTYHPQAYSPPAPAPHVPAETPNQATYPYHPPPIPPRAQEQQNAPTYYPPPTPSYIPAHNTITQPTQYPAQPAQAQAVGNDIDGESAPAPALQQAPGPQQGIPATNPQDQLDGLASQMNGLNVGPGRPNPAPQANQRFVDDNSPRPLPPIRATGTPNDVVSFCPEQRAIDYSLYWYRLPDMPKFLICTKCHLDHIQNTQLASHFERVKQPDNVHSSCCFWFPRVKEVLWPQVVQTGNLDDLREFMEKRLDILQCKGRVPVPASEGIKWFGMANAEINGFISCEACYEDRVVGTSFEPRFTAYQKQKQDEKWSCDLCVPYIARAVVEMAKRNDWSGFVAGAIRRLSSPACEGKDVKCTDCTWYLPRQKIDNVRACEACYMDKLELTRFENEFEHWTPSVDVDSFITNLTSLWNCKLHESNLPMAFALANAIERRDWSVFRNASETICRLVSCTANGIIRGNWWTLAGGCNNFDICEACYVGILQTGQTAQFFEPVEHNPEETIVCDFCVTSPRFGQYVSKYAQSLDCGVFGYYDDFVRKFAPVLVCPGIGTREKARWWGYPEALFCEDCYLSFVANTPLGKLVPVKGELDNREQICQIWSRRMRTIWLEVCNAGAPGSTESNAALAEFEAFGKKRLQVYINTVPRIKFIQKMKEIKMQNAMHQGLLSVMYNGMDGMAQVSGTMDGYFHGSSSLGWYATEHGATGAQMFNNMQAGFANANRVDEWMQMAQLESLWKEVE
ncbi:hypothetical protein PT974_04789 [Cladobotryum mycophilum]|uniref:Integral membrane protein n=1 Tax=Cladobotryum mycophilum TaxID=491253 RepID=A0ABR0SQ60_9HYPO